MLYKFIYVLCGDCNVIFVLVIEQKVSIFFCFSFISNAINKAIDRCPHWHWECTHTEVNIIYYICICLYICSYILLALTERKRTKVTPCTWVIALDVRGRPGWDFYFYLAVVYDCFAYFFFLCFFCDVLSAAEWVLQGQNPGTVERLSPFVLVDVVELCRGSARPGLSKPLRTGKKQMTKNIYEISLICSHFIARSSLIILHATAA